MISDFLIQKRLADVLSGQLSLDDFEDWFASESWNMHQHAEEPARRLAAALELRLAEFSGGHLAEAELRRELYGLLVSQHPHIRSSWTTHSTITAVALPERSFGMVFVPPNQRRHELPESRGPVALAHR